MNTFVRSFSAATLIVGVPSVSMSATPRVIPIQGQLTNSSGQPVAGASESIALTVYTAPTGGSVLYQEFQTVSLSGGRFSAVLGAGNPVGFAVLPFDVPYYLGIAVGTDDEMTPRVPLLAAPYANRAAGVADGSVGPNALASQSASLNKVSGGALSVSGGRVVAQSGAGIQGNNTLEFGAGVGGKETNAGKIGYGTFTLDALDIVGAGSAAGSRAIKFHNEGGAGFSGAVGIGTWPQASLHVRGNQNVVVIEGSDHAYIEYYPQGIGVGRAGYIGFPGAGSTTLELGNDWGGDVRVVGHFVNSSDGRLKTHVKPLDNALEDVLKLRGVSYNWRQHIPGKRMSTERRLGFIAQEVEKVLPEAVSTDERGEKAVGYIDVVPVLVEAIKEQQKQIEALKAEVAALRR